MKENNLDDIFRSGLENFEVPPPAGSWSRIESELSKKKPGGKKKNRWGYYSIALLLILSTYTAYRYFNSQDSKNVNSDLPSVTRQGLKLSTPTLYKKNTSTPVAKDNNKISEITDTKTLTADIHSTIPQTKKSSENNSIVSSELSDNSPKDVLPSGESEKKNEKSEAFFNNEQSKVSSTGKKVNASPTTAPVLASVAANHKDAGNEVVNITNESREAQKSPASNAIEPGNNQPEVLIIPASDLKNENELAASETETTNEKENITEIAPVALALQNNSTQNNTNINSSEKTGNENSIKQDQPPTDKKEITSAENTLADPIQGSNVSTTEENQSVWKKIASNLFAEVFYSPDYVNSRLEVNEDYSGTASQNINDYNNQKAAFSYSAGLNIGYDIGSKWSVLSGINYSTFSQTAVYNTINVIEDSVYKEVHGHRDNNHGGGGGHWGGHGGSHGGGHHGNNPHSPPGNNGNHYVIHTPCGAVDLYNEPPHHNQGGHYDNGDTIQVKTETSELTEYLNIPLYVRYKFGTGKFSYFVEAGGAINLVRDNMVEITINDSYTETNEHDGLKSLNYSLSLGAGVQYNFYKGLSTFLRPSFRYSITPINQNNPMSVYPYYLGLGFGLSIHF